MPSVTGAEAAALFRRVLPPLWIFDELAQCDDAALLDALETGMGTRKRSLGLILSTQAPDDAHRLSVLTDEGLAGVGETLIVQLLAAPAGADPFSEATLRAVNPALGVYLNEADLLADLRKAQWLPAFEARYRNLRLSQRVDANQENRIVPVSVWDQCARVDRPALRGKRCYGGLDLSGKADLTALVLAFPDGGRAGEPQAERGEPVSRMERAGHLIGVPDAVIRSGFIAAELQKLAAEFEIVSIAYDRWRIDDLKADLADIGCKLALEPRGQGFKDQGPDIEALAEPR